MVLLFFLPPALLEAQRSQRIIILPGRETTPGEKASADKVVTGLRDAFEDENTKAVILRINSPGGSPVQSSYMYKEILRLREKYPDIPLYAVVSDMAASGGYYVASAADEIYVSNSSIVGSIGVRMGEFGFVDTLEKLGIERRVMTAGIDASAAAASENSLRFMLTPPVRIRCSQSLV